MAKSIRRTGNAKRGIGATDAALGRFQTFIRRIVGKEDDRESLVTEIACVVGAQILSGIRAPGSGLNSVELARRFATSRTPIREALMLLEKQGLVEILPRRRPRVAGLSLVEIREIYQVRAVMIGLIASEATLHATVEDIDVLRRLLQRMDHAAATGDWTEYYWGNVAFHDCLTDIAHNRTVRRILDSLVLRSLRFRRLTLSRPERVQRSLADHANLLRAIEDRDEELAAVQAKSNVLGALRVLEASLAHEGPVPADWDVDDRAHRPVMHLD